jgi:hypothetical protein
VAWAREAWRDPRPELPGKKIFDGQIPVKAPADEYAETGIDLSAALLHGKGHVLVLVEPTVLPEGQRRSDPVAAWVQVTGIGIDAFLDSQSLVAWASSLVDGRPLGEVQFELTGAGTKGRTGTDGTATLELNHQGGLNDILLVSGTWFEGTRDDQTILNDAFARAHGLHPGDHVQALIMGRQQRLLVVGTALAPEFVYVLPPAGGMVPDPARLQRVPGAGLGPPARAPAQHPEGPGAPTGSVRRGPEPDRRRDAVRAVPGQ